MIRLSKQHKKDLQCLYDLADEARYNTSYMIHEKHTGLLIGVDPNLTNALKRMRKLFGLRK